MSKDGQGFPKVFEWQSDKGAGKRIDFPPEEGAVDHQQRGILVVDKKTTQKRSAVEGLFGFCGKIPKISKKILNFYQNIEKKL